MSERLPGKVCIITGTGGSIGREAALIFAQEGALVVGCDLQVEAAQATVEAVRAAGGTMVSLQPCRLSKPADCQALVDFAVRTFSRIDVLFNNAAMAYFNWLEDITDDEWDRNRREEVDLVFYLTRPAWPYLKASRGVIVNTASLTALMSFKKLRLPGTHHSQGWHHRYDPSAGDGRSQPWDSRQFDFAWSDRNQPNARTAERSGMGRLHAR